MSVSGAVAVVTGVITLLVSEILCQSTYKASFCQMVSNLASGGSIDFKTASSLIGQNENLHPDLSTLQGVIDYCNQLVGILSQFILLEQARNIVLVFLMAMFRDHYVTGGNLVNADHRSLFNTNEQAFSKAIGISLCTLFEGTDGEVLAQFGKKIDLAYIKTSHAVSTSDEKLDTLKEIVAILRKIILDYNGLVVGCVLVNATNQIVIPSDFEILQILIIAFHMVELQLRTPTELECTPFYNAIALASSSLPTVKVSGCASCPPGTCSGCSSSGGGAIRAHCTKCSSNPCRCKA